LTFQKRLNATSQVWGLITLYTLAINGLRITHPLHRLVRRNFQRRRTVVSGVDDQWQAHLIDLPDTKMFNDGHTFMLIVIEKFSNFAWAEPLKNKTDKSILKAFAKILSRVG